MELLAAGVIVLAVLLFGLRGPPQLARLEVRAGELRFVTGRLPPRLLEDFGDVLARRPVERATIRIVLDGGAPRVVARGVSAEQLQQLRNVAGGFSTAQFRSGRPPRR